MHYIESYFYWASAGYTDAIPAGIIAVNLGLNEADINDQDINHIREFIYKLSFLDDAVWQLGFTAEDADLIRRVDGGPAYLTASAVCPDWQWQLIKTQPGLRVSEHNLQQYVAEMDRFLQEEGEQ